MKRAIRKLIFAMIMVCFINSVYNLFLLVSYYDTRDNYEIILNKYIAEEEKMSKLSRDVYKMQSLTLSQMLSDDDVQIASLTKQIDDLHESNMELLKHIEKILNTYDEKDIYHELYSNYLNYKSEQETATDIRTHDSIKTSQYYTVNVLESRLSDMNMCITDLNKIAEEKIKAVREELDNNNRINSTMMVCVAVGSFCIMIVLIICLVKFSGNIIGEFDAEQKQHKENVTRIQSKTIEGMAELVESRDGDTGTHIKNTARYVEMIARQMATMDKYHDVMSDEYIALLKRYAPLHDVGKIVVSDTILLKPGKLTEEEFNIMKLHALEGGQIIDRILSGIENEEKVTVAKDIATYHHEKWNGTGYPFGKSGEEIPLCARIMAVADVFDALVAKRCYKEPMPIEKAYDIIVGDAGKHFDPEVVDAFVAIRPQIAEYLRKQKEKNG